MSSMEKTVEMLDESFKEGTTYDVGPAYIIEGAIQGTKYDLTIILVKNFGNIGIGYHKGESWLIINGLTRMSYCFRKGEHINIIYFAEKLFPRDYWSRADIWNCLALYNKFRALKAEEV